jgi:A/G-specific adenine glycosylase
MIKLPADFLPALLHWYKQNARPLPWRDEPTPYRVWVSEIMLQQTRIEAAREYFLRFVSVLPDVPSLAAASEETVLKLWEGLGYYSRARNLHAAAKRVVEEHGGRLPASIDALRALPGIGDYTAGAIASIAFGLPEPAVDGNVLRVLPRLACFEESIGGERVKKAFREALRPLYTEGNSALLTEALMELGEVTCTPGVPHCLLCPLSDFCAGRAAGREASLPVMPEKKARRREERTVFLLRCGDRVAIRKRGRKGLLAGLWEFPNVSGPLSSQEARKQAADWGCVPGEPEAGPSALHIFTHIEWEMQSFCIPCAVQDGSFTWVTGEGLSAYALPTAFRTYRLFLRNGQ